MYRAEPSKFVNTSNHVPLRRITSGSLGRRSHPLQITIDLGGCIKQSKQLRSSSLLVRLLVTGSFDIRLLRGLLLLLGVLLGLLRGTGFLLDIGGVKIVALFRQLLVDSGDGLEEFLVVLDGEGNALLS